jgi:hypothetical protein
MSVKVRVLGATRIFRNAGTDGTRRRGSHKYDPTNLFEARTTYATISLLLLVTGFHGLKVGADMSRSCHGCLE